MQKWLPKCLLGILLIVFVVSAIAQTPIRDIQFTEDASGDSPLKGQIVTVQGIVTAEHRGEVRANGGISGSYFFMMDSSAAWAGIQVYYSDTMVAAGDLVSVTGTVSEYYNQTQIGDVTDVTIVSSGNPIPGPLVVTSAAAAAEAYECCLIQVNDVTISETDIGNYGEWKIDDGSGAIKIGTRAKTYFTPVLNDPVTSVTGINVYSYGQFVIEPRLARDIVEAGPYTRMQYIQQVRNSDVVKALEDTYSDTSYFNGETFTVKGVVTMPTGLSYAGAGIKFIMQEEEGGPWSGIMSYNADSTAYPTLFEGDVIEMTGYIDEYRTGVANMTEFFITSPINILDFGQPIPEADEVATGDLRVPETAEQWGNCMVTVKNAEVTDVNLAFELFAVDDGSGEVKVDDDSDSLQTFYDTNPLPPVGSVAESMRGWVYHHYGDYTNLDAYKLEPLYMSDIVWGAGAPPVMGDVTRDIGVPMATDDVTVSTEVASDVGLASVKIYYTVSADGQPGAYQEVDMTNVSDDVYEGVIPAQTEGSFVNYYVKASDTAAQEATKPADLAVQNYCYIVSSEALTIADIQYTPWDLADSPLEGQKVMVTGVVTSDTASLNQFEAYSIQDVAGEWNGIYIFGTTQELDRGTQVEVYGTVTDYNPDWSFKWDNNTVILTDSVKVLGAVEEIAPVVVTTGELATNPEAYESVLVQIQNATFVGTNQYDVSFDDGSGEVLLDADFIVDGDQYENPYFYLNSTADYVVAWGDTVRPGEVVSNISGIFTFSFGSFKIELRDAADFGAETGVNPDFNGRVFDFALNQNYPNPFNPETRISFEIPQTENVKLAIYNVLGQQVIKLTDQAYEAGRHIINWNGHDTFGNMVPSGMYFYRIKAGDFMATKRMLLMK